MAALMRAHDWAGSPVGPVEGWPQGLRALVKTLLASGYPMVLTWGPEFVQFYNDAYSKLLGDKHPAALGRDIRVSMAEAWGTLGPMIEEVLATGVANRTPALLLGLERAGYREESYFSVSHAPAEDDDGRIGGTFGICGEVTEQVLRERRLGLLRDLAAGTRVSGGADATCRDLIDGIAGHPLDVPFALLYLREPDGTLALRGAVGLPEGSPAAPSTVDPTADDAVWPFGRSAAGETVLVEEVGRRAILPGGPWGEPTRAALALPIASSGQPPVLGVLVAGTSPNRALDDAYRAFYGLLAAQIWEAVRNARAYEEERERAEALAALDRAKSVFFSNVSHEFRTPLTLMLGLVEELVADQAAPPTPSQRERLEIAHRNALRLLRLVNALLDLSRIEAGRAEAVVAPTDLAALTADVASSFRSTIERAGLSLVVRCPPLPRPVAVDRGMWEKIVLNLLSNAFKHTFAGEISVSLGPADGEPENRVELVVGDTGVGIPPAELPRIFERFYRVPSERARAREGTGIGLALVQELARLHGGEVRVESVLGAGTRFTVAIPADATGTDPARDEADAATLAGTAEPFLEEARRWLPDVPASSAGAGHPVPRPRVLLADDNADVRAYLRRLLGSRYAVEAVADGVAALAAARARPPDLLIADVMMPKLDGVGLLRALRTDARTSAVPVMLLSARAGEESRVEGLEAGADDYLFKPFYAKELLARVGARIELTRLRAELARSEREHEATQEAVAARDRFLSIAAHELRTPVTAVKAAAHLLDRAQRRPEQDPARVARFVGRLVEAADRLASMTDDLLDVSRLHLDRLPLRRRPIDVAALARGVVDDRREQLAEPGRLRLETPGGAVPIVADPARLEQVLCNLLDNAAAYAPRGEILVVVQPLADGVEVAVHDAGIGLTPGTEEAIFAPFGRSPNAEARFVAGLGLGLYISRGIVEQHGGWIRAESAGEDRGTTIRLWLPNEDVGSSATRAIESGQAAGG
jgi:signal transduction histidine kinase